MRTAEGGVFAHRAAVCARLWVVCWVLGKQGDAKMVYVGVWVHVHTGMGTHAHASACCVQTCTCVQLHAGIHVSYMHEHGACRHVCMHVHRRVHVCGCMHVHVQVHVCLCVCMHVCASYRGPCSAPMCVCML